jgi:hypothetical protein
MNMNESMVIVAWLGAAGGVDECDVLGAVTGCVLEWVGVGE